MAQRTIFGVVFIVWCDMAWYNVKVIEWKSGADEFLAMETNWVICNLTHFAGLFGENRWKEHWYMKKGDIS